MKIRRFCFRVVTTQIFTLFFILSLTSYTFANEFAAFSHGNREEKKIALTFDDGPHPKYTEEILDLLAFYQIKATFFMIGKNVSLYPETAKRVACEGHEIGSHTYTHPHMLHITAKELSEELQKTENVMRSLGLPKPTLFRPPEGYRTKEQIQTVRDAGYTMVIWSLDTHDWRSTPSAHIVEYTSATVQGGDVLLFHDYISGQNTTIAALKKLIPMLLKDGYQFVSVSELIF